MKANYMHYRKTKKENSHNANYLETNHKLKTLCSHQSKNLLKQESSIDAKSRRGKSDEEQNIYTISKYLFTNYLIMAK